MEDNLIHTITHKVEETRNDFIFTTMSHIL